MKFKVLIAILIASGNLLGQKSSVETAKMFLNGTELTHKVTIGLKAGENEILISGLATGINNASIELKSNDNIKVLNYNMVNEYINYDKTEQFISLKKSIDSLEAVLASQKSNLEILNFQSEIIKTNSNLTNSKFTSVDIKNLMDNARKELELISKSKLKVESEIKLVSEEIDRYKKQLTFIKLGFSNINLKANVFAARGGKHSLELKYFTNTAFWTPVYAFDFVSKDKALDLQLKANITQKTSIDWKKVSLTLSTFSPTFNVSKPELEPKFVYFQPIYEKSNALMSRDASTVQMVEDEVSYGKLGGEAINLDAPSFSSSESDLEIEYTFSDKVDLVNGTSNQKYDIKTYQINANYSYHAVPSFTQHVFMVAELTDESQLPTKSGQVTVSRNGSFVAYQYLQRNTKNNKLNLTLYKDENITCRKSKTSDFGETKFLSSYVNRKIGYKYELKNLKNEEIDLIIEDQIPLSTTEKIEFKDLKLAGATHDVNTGFLNWTKTLKAKSNDEFQISYIVVYPSDQQIINLE